MHYSKAVDEVVTKTMGSDTDGSWNRNFRANLEKHGLRLSTELPKVNDKRYPEGMPYWAPYPYGPLNGWSRESYIVYSD